MAPSTQQLKTQDGDHVPAHRRRRRRADGLYPARALEPHEQPLPLQHARGGRAGRAGLRAAAGGGARGLAHVAAAAAQRAPPPGGDGAHQRPHPRRGELGAPARGRAQARAAAHAPRRVPREGGARRRRQAAGAAQEGQLSAAPGAQALVRGPAPEAGAHGPPPAAQVSAGRNRHSKRRCMRGNNVKDAEK
ncbi:hypothetical protein ON010_g17139 [Phytophthora cinnamomi]|nr:hypothetical protein ON010_g17139 [Phytophthora cinnamomi]